MGSWDCYCALCAGPLGAHNVKVGDNTPKALAKRRKAIKKKIRELRANQDTCKDAGRKAGETTCSEEEKDEVWADLNLNVDDSLTKELPPVLLYAAIGTGQNPDFAGEIDEEYNADSERSDLSLRYNEKFYHGQAPGESMYDYYEEKMSYDPSLVLLGDVEWLDQCRVLGYNTEAPGVAKAFISGRGQYDDYGSFHVKNPGDDENDPHMDYYECYSTSAGTTAFPFHEACYRVLARHLGYKDPGEINKDILYEAMSEYSEDYCSNLELDFGGLVVQQFWNCTPGEEYFVRSPDTDIKLLSKLPDLLPVRLIHTSALPDLSHKIHHDPLEALPFDLLYGICQFLSVQDVLSFMQASWHTLVMTRNRSFWRQMTRKHLEPWFWELRDLLAHEEPNSEFDGKGMFLWLNKITQPRFGIERPFMGIANRRRIWSVCEQLTPTYNLKMCHEVQTDQSHEKKENNA